MYLGSWNVLPDLQLLACPHDNLITNKVNSQRSSRLPTENAQRISNIGCLLTKEKNAVSHAFIF